MKIIEAKGQITWIDDESVGYNCECGEQLQVDIYGNPNMERWQQSKTICPKCKKELFLKQSNIVYEVIEEC